MLNDEDAGYYRTAMARRAARDQRRRGRRAEENGARGRGALEGRKDRSRGISPRSCALGRLDYGTLLGIVPVLAKDKNAHVVAASAAPIVAVRDIPLIDAESRPRFARFVQATFGARAPCALRLKPKPSDDEQTRFLRPLMVDLVADEGEDAGLRAECAKLAKAWIADKNAVDAELVPTVLSVAAAFGDRALFLPGCDELAES